MIRRVRCSAAVAAAVMLVALAATAGCGSPGAETGMVCTEPGVEPNSIKVGLLYSDTGPLAGTFSPARSGVEARIELANASGGINGRQIEIEWRDDQSTSGVNLITAGDLVEKAGVFGIIEATASASGSADYLESHGVPVTGLAAEAIWSTHRNMFTVSNRPVDGPSITTYGAYARAQGGTRAFLLQGGSSASYKSGRKFRTSLEAAGIPVVAQEEYVDSVIGTTALAAKIKASNADVIAGAISGFGLATVLQAVRAAGVEMKVVFGPEGYDLELLAKFGSTIAGLSTYTTVAPFELDLPATERYRDAMARYAPELLNVGRSTATYGYIAADIFIRGLESAGKCPTRANFIAGLRGVTGYNADGLLAGKVDFQSTSLTNETCYYFIRVNAEGTGFEVMNGGQGIHSNEWCGTMLPG